MQRNGIILASALPLAHPRLLTDVPFAKNGSQLAAAQAWSAARSRLACLLPPLAPNWPETVDCRALRETLQQVRAEADATWRAWQTLFQFLWSTAELDTYDVPGSQPLFGWTLSQQALASHSLVFESAALLYTLLAAHQNLALIAYAQTDLDRVEANLAECTRHAEHAVRHVLPLHGMLQPGDGPAVRAPLLLSRHLWCECLAPLVAAQRRLMIAVPSPLRPHTLAASAHCALGAELLRDALANVPPALLGDGVRQTLLRELAALAATSRADLGAHLAAHAAPLLDRVLLEAAWTLMQPCVSDDHIAIATRRCVGTLRVVGGEPRALAIAEIVAGDRWAFTVAGELLVPCEE